MVSVARFGVAFVTAAALCAPGELLASSVLPVAGQAPKEQTPTSADAQRGRAPDGPGTVAKTDNDEDQQRVDLQELRRRLDVLAEEVERLRSGEPEIEPTVNDARALGLAPSAAATYRRSQGVSIAGYGEMLYENFAEEDERGRTVSRGAQLDFLRAIIYAGYRFSDAFVFNSEIELEHANEVSVEFAYVEYLATENFSARAGMLLVPLGLVNEFHEPNVFLGAKRPETERRIIPTTWRENGAGVVGSAGRFSYRAYVINGLNALGFSAEGIRGGRQKGSKARASDLAFVGRLDVTPIPGVLVGGGFYTGGSGQRQVISAGDELSVWTTIGEFHGQAQIRGFDVRGLYARATIGNAAELNQQLGLSGVKGIASSMAGGYLQIGYDLLSQVMLDTSVMPFYRFERVNTQATMPEGFVRDLATDGTFHTFGVELKPIPNIVVKADYQWMSTGAAASLNQFNLAMGYAF